MRTGWAFRGAKGDFGALWLEHTMTQSTEAVFSNGVLRPTRELGLRDQQRVRLIVETLDDAPADRNAALARLRAGISRMQFFSQGSLPTRGQLHDRS